MRRHWLIMPISTNQLHSYSSSTSYTKPSSSQIFFRLTHPPSPGGPRPCSPARWRAVRAPDGTLVMWIWRCVSCKNCDIWWKEEENWTVIYVKHMHDMIEWLSDWQGRECRLRVFKGWGSHSVRWLRGYRWPGLVARVSLWSPSHRDHQDQNNVGWRYSHIYCLQSPVYIYISFSTDYYSTQ